MEACRVRAASPPGEWVASTAAANGSDQVLWDVAARLNLGCSSALAPIERPQLQQRVDKKRYPVGGYAPAEVWAATNPALEIRHEFGGGRESWQPD